MSSAANSVKNSASETAADEPDAKKAKLVLTDDIAELQKADNNNGTNASDKVANSGSSSSKSASNSGVKVPSKTANGKDKQANIDELGSADDADDASESSEQFDPRIAQSLEEVEQIQEQISKLNEQASEEILKVEQKFNGLRRPHFEKRNSILKEIPNFWLTSLANHPLIAPMVQSTAEDEDCLHYLNNLDVEEYEDIKTGYKLNFHFAENPYIKNELIVREIRHIQCDDAVSEFTTTPIEFKDTAQGKTLKQVVDRSIAQYRRKSQPHNSFFAWLSSQPRDVGSLSDEIAEIIKDQIWPSPLDYFFRSGDSDVLGSDDESDDEDEYDEELDNDDDAGIPEDGVLDDEELDNEEEDNDDDDDDDDDEEDEE